MLRFNDKTGKEVIIADNALFVGSSHFPFKIFYEKLENLRFDGNTLYFDMLISSGSDSYRRTKKIEIPAEHKSKTTEIETQLKEKYLS